jgi:hypothetical protein
MKTKKFGISLHLVVLLIALLLSPPSLERLTGSLEGFFQFVFAILFLLIMFYVSFYWLVPAYLAEKRVALFVILFLIMANGLTFVGYITLQLSHLGFTHSGEGLKYSLSMHFSGFHAITMAALFGSLFRVVYEWYSLLPVKKN